jgi:hypothetical protein
MPFIPAPNLVSVEFRTTWAGQQCENRINVDLLTAPTAANVSALATACEQWWEDNVVAITPSNLTLREVFVRDQSQLNGFAATAAPAGAIPGTGGGASLPNNVSICASIRTLFTGRSARGRWYWQGLMEPDVVDNEVNSGRLADIDAALTNLASVIAGLSHFWVIASYFQNGAPRVGGPVYFVVDQIVFVDGVVDSQRRRLPGRGT